MGGVLSDGGRRPVLIVLALALSAAAARLLPLGWLHPLNFDEVEFFRATDWVRQGLVPYRDFWQNHTPLQWYLFAPLSALAGGDGVTPVIVMRWLQVPVWIAAFWLVNRWMRDLELPPRARWSALALALSSSWLMIPTVEYRLDSVGAALYLGGLVLALRGRFLVGGIVFCLAGFANLRLGPLLAATAILFCITDLPARRWTLNRRALRLLAGVVLAAATGLGAFAAIGGLDEAWRQLIVENYLGDRLVEPSGQFFQRLFLIPVGIASGTGRVFMPATVDPGAIVLIAAGFLGVFRALRNWRAPDPWLAAALLQLASIAFLARMKVIYNYHFLIAGLMFIPFLAAELARLRRRELAWAAVGIAWCVNLYACVLRGKEHDRTYQDIIIREVHRRTLPGEPVFSGAALALRRPPAYRRWMLVDLNALLVQHRHARPYTSADLIRNPPAALIADYYTLRYLGMDSRLRRLVVRHYLPVWRNLWIPAPNGLLTPAARELRWLVLRDGDYRVYAAPSLARHPWFDKPVFVGVMDRPDAARFPLRAGRPGLPPGLELSVDGVPAATTARLRLKKGQQLTARWGGGGAVGVMLLPGTDELWFRNPPPGVTLEAAYPRVTHWPRF